MRLMNKNCVLLLLLSSYSYLKADPTYKLSEAIQKKLVNANMRGAKQDTSFHGQYSSHYGPCMAMEIANASSDAINLNLEYGYKLEPVDSSLQTMLVTQTMMTRLQPKQLKNYRIYAMCTQAHDGGPSPDTK